MVGATRDGSLPARPKSGIAPRLPQVTPSNPPTRHSSSPPATHALHC